MEKIINMFLPDENRSISTLVFMDLEATGLPSFIGKKSVHITEISLVAIDRDDFERDETFRVLNKLNLCIRPRAVISHGAMSITGLYNDILENQEMFDESIPKLLKYFFKRLRSPVCLLAHNGKRYDFPLLQAELKRINYELGPEVLCVDTLEALKSILNHPVKIMTPQEQNGTSMAKESTSYLPVAQNQNVVKTPPEETDSCDKQGEQNKGAKTLNIVSSGANMDSWCKHANMDSTTSDEEIDNLLSEDIDLFNSIEMPTKVPVLNATESTPTTIVNDSKDVSSKTISFQNEHTPSSRIVSVAEQVPKKRRKKNLDTTFTPKKQYKPTITPSFLHSDVRKKLFEDGADKNESLQKDIPPAKPLQFSLPKLYQYFFGEDPPISHYAEADCIALSKVCQKVNEEFLKWIDENSIPFNEIKEMW